MVAGIVSRIKTTLKFEDMFASLLSEEMRRKYIKNHSIDPLSMRPGHTKEKGNFIGLRSKYRGRFKSPGYPLKKLCWKCDKLDHFKKNCR